MILFSEMLSLTGKIITLLFTLVTLEWVLPATDTSNIPSGHRRETGGGQAEDGKMR
jgi:hypothetical protein